MKKAKTIALCASAFHYQRVLEVEKELKTLGYRVLLPDVARVMQKTNNFDVSTYRIWERDKKGYKKKNWYMKEHFRKIIKSDAILVVNFEKKEYRGYIGGNVLMEMALALYLKKKIFVLNTVDDTLPNKEEVFGVLPIFLLGTLKNISKYI